jgi:hypothetical protein
MELMLRIGSLTNTNVKGPFFSSNYAINLKGVTQITVTSLIERANETNAGLNGYHFATPVYLFLVTAQGTLRSHSYSSSNSI